MGAKELNIGDYVRTKKGSIAKYLGFEKDKYDTNYNKYLFDGKIYCYYEYYNYYNEYVYEEDFEDWLENEVIKSSSNIIDLIEVGDYVNGYKVMGFKNEYIAIDNEIDDFVEKRGKFIVLGNEEGHYGVPAEGIKSIVTREMFESMEYKIGEKE